MRYDIKIPSLYSSAPKRKTIPKGLKESVWRKYFGARFNGNCYVCKAPITFTNFEVGHNRAVVKGGSTHIGNLRPICRSCNRSMGRTSIEVYKKKYYSRKKLKKSAKRKRKAKRQTGYFDVPRFSIPRLRI